jgi:hypothetical protein
MAPLTRGEASRAISAAIHPPTEFPITVTSSAPSWPVSVGHGEPGDSGHDVEPLVVPGVPVLRRAVGVCGEGDLPDAEPVAGRSAVFEDPHLHRAQLDRLAASGRDHRDSCHGSSIRESSLSRNINGLLESCKLTLMMRSGMQDREVRDEGCERGDWPG